MASLPGALAERQPWPAAAASSSSEAMPPPPIFPVPPPFAHDSAEDLPRTPRSPSPTLSPPSSPKRQRAEAARAEQAAVDSAAEDDLEMRAAALGLNEATQRVWKETALPPTPSSPSPTFSPPSSPKQRRQAELTAEAAAAKLAASLKGAEMQRRFNHSSLSAEGGRSCDSDSDASMAAAASEVQIAIAAWEASGGRESRESGGSSSRKRR